MLRPATGELQRGDIIARVPVPLLSDVNRKPACSLGELELALVCSSPVETSGSTILLAPVGHLEDHLFLDAKTTVGGRPLVVKYEDATREDQDVLVSRAFHPHVSLHVLAIYANETLGFPSHLAADLEQIVSLPGSASVQRMLLDNRKARLSPAAVQMLTFKLSAWFSLPRRADRSW